MIDDDEEHYRDCDRCEERFWDEDIETYGDVVEIHGEDQWLCHSCQSELLRRQRY